MTVTSYFSANYTEARNKFLSACAARGADVDSRMNPKAVGATGETLYMDIVRFGSAQARKVLFLMSGTHGVEGYCGSGAQIGFLTEAYFSDLPDDVSVVLVHAMNPYGFSHNRRVNEDNVDLNRNFLDFSKPERPVSTYGDIHAHVLPEDWDGPARKHANKQLALFIEEHGMRTFQAAVSGGQYQYADGIFYGGSGPTWSNETFRSVVRDYANDVETVCFIDFHTGLGPYGYGELISLGSLDQKAHVRQWFGDEVTDPDAGTSTSAPVVGTVGHGVADLLPDASIAFIALEYGTRELNQVLTALRADNWLYHKGVLDSDLGARIKAEIRDAFYPDKEDWKEMVWARAQEVTERALSGLSVAE
ncbi:MAG: M14 family metallopeptidase [Pseudomonadota bacterium]